jgi:hypothetical protein
MNVPSYEQYLQARMNAPRVPIDGDHIKNLRSGRATAAVRRDGAMILYCTLMGRDGLTTILTGTFGDYQVPKLGASHPMSPVGPSTRPGGQHGPLRWLEYKERTATSSEDQLVLRSDVPPDAPIGCVRAIELSENAIKVSTRVLNQTLELLPTSIGEHFYFGLPVEPTDKQRNARCAYGRRCAR